MILLGGLVFRDQSQQVETILLRKMAGTVSSPRDWVGVSNGPFGLFTTGGPTRLESDTTVLLSQDADLPNFPRLASLLGRQDARGGLLSALYRLDGWRFVSRLEGGFSVALWDRERHELVLAVDRFGIKQLHYAVDNTMLAFASKPSALLTLPGVEQRIDPTAALGSLRSGFVAPQPSMWGAIRRLAPGQLLRWRDGQLKIEVNVAPNIRGSREPDRLYRAKEAM